MPQWLNNIIGGLRDSSWLKGSAVLALLGTAFVLGGRAGCYFASPLEVKPINAQQPTEGVVYFLQRSLFEVDATYRITKCEVVAVDSRSRIDVEGSVSVQIKPASEPDFSRGYVVTADSLAGALWRSDVSIETPKGLLKSMNAASKNEVSVPKSTDPGSLAQLLLSGFHSTERSSAEKSAADLRELVCGASLIAALARAKAGGPDAKDAGANDALVLRRTIRFVPGQGCPAGTQTAGQAEAGTQRCRLESRDTIQKMLKDPEGVADDLAKYSLEFDIVEINRAASGARPFAKSGVVYRIPGLARVTICMPGCQSAEKRVLLEQSIDVSQFGIEAVLPIERRLFSDRTVKLEFGDGGDLKSGTFSDAKAAEAKP